MKGTLRYQVEGRTAEQEVNYIPVRFILAIALAVMETIAVIACRISNRILRKRWKSVSVSMKAKLSGA